MIKEVISSVIGSFILIISMEYVVYQLVSNREKLNLKKFFILCFVQSVLTIFMYFIDKGIIRVVVMYIIIAFFSKIQYKKDNMKTLLAAFITYVLTIISEVLFSFIVVSVFKLDIEAFKEGYFLTLLSNLCISVILLLFIHIKKLKNFLRNLVMSGNKTYINKIILIVISTILTLEFLSYYIYFEVNALYTMLLNLFLIVVYVGLSIMFFKENNDKEQMKSKYDNMVDNSEKYERVIEQLRMANHENKNNLIVLKGMLKSNNKIVKEYIDDLIADERKEDNDLLLKTNNIPTGGLQGLIYQKLLDMKDKNIDYHLEVSKDINKKKIENINVKTNKDLCTIAGIFLDNAIQAVENIDNKNIGIYLYQEQNQFIISISNIYKGKIDLQRMADKGYTTKENGHGYGLSLVKEILDKNKKFHNEKAICGNVFIQKIKLDLDKK